MKREPCVSGRFYPSTKELLLRELESFCSWQEDVKKAKGVILPHAGYIYSGKVAGKTLSQVVVPESAVLVGPNHTGRGEIFSLWKGDDWFTPLGKVEVDRELISLLLKNSDILRPDIIAHQFEHCLEVILPFLQYFNPQVKLTPILLGGGKFEEWIKLANDIFKAIQELKKEVLVIASSDFSHYEPDSVARRKDSFAIQAILELDEEEFLKRVMEEGVSICGYMPIIVLIAYCKLCGCKNAELISYMTSGDVIGDRDSVVGYAGIIFY